MFSYCLSNSALLCFATNFSLRGVREVWGISSKLFFLNGAPACSSINEKDDPSLEVAVTSYT
jgi:hypothetical protein